MDSLLARKLNCFVPLTAADRHLLADALEPTRTIEARADIAEEGEDPRSIHVVQSGWACRITSRRSRCERATPLQETAKH